MEDLIDQDANLTVAITTVQNIQVFFNTIEHCDCCMYHISNNDILQFFHTLRSRALHVSYNTHRLLHHQLVLPITDTDIPREIGTNFYL
jgi:hypothetical protein